jgi:hypothetical protein
MTETQPNDQADLQATTPAGAPPVHDPEYATEEELRAAYEAELARATTGDLLVQMTASLINLGARRLGLTGAPESERDLGQVRDAVDSVRALMPVLQRSAPAEHLPPLRDALAQLQMAYAREAAQAPDAAAPPGPQPQPSQPPEPTPPASPTAPAAAATAPDPPGPAPGSGATKGPAEASGRLWVPGRG